MRQQEAKLKQHNFTKYTSATMAQLFLLAYYQIEGFWRGLISGSMGCAHCYVRPPLTQLSRLHKRKIAVKTRIFTSRPVAITTRVMNLLSTAEENNNSYFKGHVPKDIIVYISRVECIYYIFI